MDDEKPRRPRAEAEPAGLSPVRAFVLLGVIATALAGGIAAATREAPAPEPGVTTRRSPDYSLTDAEAIAEFRVLHAKFRAASKGRDQSLVDQLLTSDSPLQPVARRQIRQLIADGVVDRSRFELESIEVVSNTPSEIGIEQIVVIHPRFVSEASGEVVSSRRPLRQRVMWDLALEGSVWKVYDSEVVSSKAVR